MQVPVQLRDWERTYDPIHHISFILLFSSFHLDSTSSYFFPIQGKKSANLQSQKPQMQEHTSGSELNRRDKLSSFHLPGKLGVFSLCIPPPKSSQKHPPTCHLNFKNSDVKTHFRQKISFQSISLSKWKKRVFPKSNQKSLLPIKKLETQNPKSNFRPKISKK